MSAHRASAWASGVSSGPGAIAVRSGWRITWSSGWGSSGSSTAAGSFPASRARAGAARAPRPVRPRSSASLSVQVVRWSRKSRPSGPVGPPRSGRCQRSAGSRVSAAAVPPGGSSASRARVAWRTGGARVRSSSAPSAARALPLPSGVPVRPATRVVASQSRASSSQRSATGCWSQLSYAGVGAQRSSASPSGASRPETYASSSQKAATGSEHSSVSAARFRSRTPRPPARRVGGDCRPQASSSSSTVRTAVYACPAAALSTACGSRRASAAGTGRVASTLRWVRPPRRCRASSRGSTTDVGLEGSSRPRASSHSTGLRTSSAVTWRAASGTVPVGGPQTSRSSRASAGSGASASSAVQRLRSESRPASAATAETGSGVAGSPAPASSCWRRAGDIPVVASASVGPRPVRPGLAAVGASASRTAITRRSAESGPQSSDCARSVARAPGSAAVTAWRSTGSAWACGLTRAGPVSRLRTRVSWLASGAAARASATWRVNLSSRSSARSAEARPEARAASCVRSLGTGLSRSGRLWSSSASASSLRARSSSASVRGAAEARGGRGSLCWLLIRSRLDPLAIR